MSLKDFKRRQPKERRVERDGVLLGQVLVTASPTHGPKNLVLEFKPTFGILEVYEGGVECYKGFHLSLSP